MFCFLEYCNLSVEIIADNDEGDDWKDSGSINIRWLVRAIPNQPFRCVPPDGNVSKKECKHRPVFLLDIVIIHVNTAYSC